ncbi:adenylyltransferase/cytidyltransferase family protein [bacterium]|nr:adenylyltransferase/cytidyltransferase family protein [bacterium]
MRKLTSKKKRVLVSGCFDLLHAGHIAFFKTASTYGQLYVSVGTDQNIRNLKGKSPTFSQEERLYMVNAVRYVHQAFLSSGSGILDYKPDLIRLRPEVFIVNSDGHTEEKERLCSENGVEYIVLDRIPEPGLTDQASSEIKKDLRLPYRICLAGGWLDQPWVSEWHPGSVIVVQIKPTIDFHERSGLGTSSRKVARELWGDRIPKGDPVRNARLLFGAENPPGAPYVSGSQDHLGLMLPGINRLFYEGDYWPSRIDSLTDPDTAEWLEKVIHLIPIHSRPMQYDPIRIKHLTVKWVQKLAESGELCWQSIRNKDVAGLGRSLTLSLQAWKHILPMTVLDESLDELKKYASYPGAIFSGSGGGYIVAASEEPIPEAQKIKIRI